MATWTASRSRRPPRLMSTASVGRASPASSTRTGATGSLIGRAANARGEYRGLPKCGQPTKFFHCGYGYGQYKTDNPFSSRVTVRESRPRPHRVRDARRQVGLPVGFLPGPRDADALADRPPDVLVPLRRDAGRYARRREGLRHPPRRPEDDARPGLVAGRPLGLFRRGRDARRFRLRQPPGARARRGRLLCLLALS